MKKENEYRKEGKKRDKKSKLGSRIDSKRMKEKNKWREKEKKSKKEKAKENGLGSRRIKKESEYRKNKKKKKAKGLTGKWIIQQKDKEGKWT